LPIAETSIMNGLLNICSKTSSSSDFSNADSTSIIHLNINANNYINYGKFDHVNSVKRTVAEHALGTLCCKPSKIKKMVRKVINKAKWRRGGNHPKMQWSEVKWSEVRRNEVRWREIVVKMWRMLKCSETEWREGHDEMWVLQFMSLRTSSLLLFTV
jgi:hypothetical protein